MKKIYKMAIISFALAFAACDDSTAASENGDDDSNVACTDEPVDCPSIFVENAVHDSRDCHWYKVAEFGTQTWMIENLNYNSCHLKGQTWCYDGNAANCEQYGRLYTWTAAMGLDKSYQKKYANLPEGTVTSGLCPSGYHIPSDAETDVLIAYLEENNKVAEFNFQFGGKNNFAGFAELGRKAYFWTADEDHSEFGGEENVRIWSYSETFSFGGGSIFKDSGLSVRCVKD
jgi:hypothetical protein